MNRVNRLLVVAVSLAWALHSSLAQDKDWPQWRGPNRDGVVTNSPKLADSWPTNGPALLWKSEWIPSQFNGNESSPVVAEGKVFLFVAWRQPAGGGSKARILTTETLVDAGWLPDLPEELAKKVEQARTSKAKPKPHGNYIDNLDDAYTKAMEDAFLAKKPDMDKYIQDFMATLDPKDVAKYGAYIRRRVSMTSAEDTQFGPPALTWDDLVKLSKLRDAEFETYAESRNKVRETLGHDVGYSGSSQFLMRAWRRAAPRADTVICLDAATGKLLWKNRLLAEDHELLLTEHSISGKTSDYAGVGVCATPAVWNGKCYAQGAGGLYCLSARDGSVIWQAKDAKITHGSPLVADGVVFQYDQAYNAETGAVLWKTERGKSWAYRDFANYSPVLWTVGGKKYIIGQNQPDRSWACMELETGKVCWTLDKSGVSHLDLLSPVIRDNILVQCVSCRGKKTVRAFKLSPTEATLLWENDKTREDSWPAGSLAIWQGHVYQVQAGEFVQTTHRCLDLTTGEIKWETKPIVEDLMSISQQIVADGKIFRPVGECERWIFGGTSAFEMVSATPEKYVKLGHFDAGACPLTSPAIADGRLYLRLEKCVACYDLRAK